jgi:hypothetical protein
METEHKWKFPPCFSSRKDYELWLDGPYQENLSAQHCTDCLPSFKMRMAKAGRCEHPETTFRFTPQAGFDPDDLGVHIYGHWGREPQPQVVRFVKVHKLAPKPKPKLEPVKPALDYWQEQERKMRERMSFGR